MSGVLLRTLLTCEGTIQSCFYSYYFVKIDATFRWTYEIFYLALRHSLEIRGAYHENLYDKATNDSY